MITPVSTAGFGFYTQNGAHLVVDIAGWYTGTEVPTVLPPHVPLTGARRPAADPPFTFSDVINGTADSMEPVPAPIRYMINMGGYDATASVQ